MTQQTAWKYDAADLQEHEGLIWVYGSSGPEAFEESKTKERPSSPKVGHPDYVSVPGWFMRELPYGADVLAENVSSLKGNVWQPYMNSMTKVNRSHQLVKER